MSEFLSTELEFPLWWIFVPLGVAGLGWLWWKWIGKQAYEDENPLPIFASVLALGLCVAVSGGGIQGLEGARKAEEKKQAEILREKRDAEYGELLNKREREKREEEARIQAAVDKALKENDVRTVIVRKKCIDLVLRNGQTVRVLGEGVVLRPK